MILLLIDWDQNDNMMRGTIYDIIGIGIGPFNLGLAALADSIPDLKCLFIDENPTFNWHPGLMLDTARLQVPFYADLVTLADPCSRYSYLAFLKSKQRLFRFAIHENNFVTRREYNEYCQWVVAQLKSFYFGFRCEVIHYNEPEQVYSVYVRDVNNKSIIVFRCRNIVIGVGTVPRIPECCSNQLTPNLTLNPSPKGEGFASGKDKKQLIFHSSDYLYFKERLLTKKAVTIVGSGQSAAEIFYDLLQHHSQFSNGLNWFTRAERFYPMEYSKLSLEMTSPDYIEYFYRLCPEKKEQVLSKQNMLYNGINFSLINQIYDELYLQSLNKSVQHIHLSTNCTLQELRKTVNDGVELCFHHSDLEQSFTHCTEAVILATGYKSYVPEFIEPIRDRILWTINRQYQVNRNYSIDTAQSIFVQNAELHTHGFNAPDLGMGPYRNATILNAILEYEHFSMEKNITFQSFEPSTSP